MASIPAGFAPGCGAQGWQLSIVPMPTWVNNEAAEQWNCAAWDTEGVFIAE